MNSVCIGDWDFYNNPSNEGHYLIAFTVEKDMKLPVGTKFCQGIIQRYCLMEDDDADGTRTGGVGSTGL